MAAILVEQKQWDIVKKYKAYLTVATLKNHKCLGKKLQLSEKT